MKTETKLKEGVTWRPLTVNPPLTCAATIPRTIHDLTYDEPLDHRNEVCRMADASFRADAYAELFASAPAVLAERDRLREINAALKDALKAALSKIALVRAVYPSGASKHVYNSALAAEGTIRAALALTEEKP